MPIPKGTKCWLFKIRVVWKGLSVLDNFHSKRVSQQWPILNPNVFNDILKRSSLPPRQFGGVYDDVICNKSMVTFKAKLYFFYSTFSLLLRAIRLLINK